MILAPKLAIIFRALLGKRAFPVCLLTTNVTSVLNGFPSIHPRHYRPISLTPALSKIFDRLLAKRLTRLLDIYYMLPSSQFVFRKRSQYF